jgi:hypothetical protein
MSPYSIVDALYVGVAIVGGSGVEPLKKKWRFFTSIFGSFVSIFCKFLAHGFRRWFFNSG